MALRYYLKVVWSMRKNFVQSFVSVRNIFRNKFSWLYISLNFFIIHSARVKAKNALFVLLTISNQLGLRVLNHDKTRTSRHDK